MSLVLACAQEIEKEVDDEESDKKSKRKKVVSFEYHYEAEMEGA